MLISSRARSRSGRDIHLTRSLGVGLGVALLAAGLTVGPAHATDGSASSVPGLGILDPVDPILDPLDPILDPILDPDDPSLPLPDPSDPSLPLPEVPILLPGTDTTEPQTTIAGGKTVKGWLLRRAISYQLGADEEATFGCTLNGKTDSRCDDTDKVTLRRLGSRTHVFRAFAVDAAGNEDATPARRVFSVPRNNATLRHAPAWHKRRAKGHFLNSFSETTRQGAVLSTRARGIKRIALVASRGRGHGRVAVYLGQRLLKTVSLSARRDLTKRVIPVASFQKKQRGLIRLKVVTRGKVVRVEGVGIASR